MMKAIVISAVALLVTAGAILTGIVAPAGPALAASSSHPVMVPTAAGQQVTIVRDANGEPHIFAPSAYAAEFGFGYAQMEDQGSYVLDNIADANGQGAATQGPGCLPGCFNQDQLTDLFRIPQSVSEEYGTLPANSRLWLQGFADGINAYILAHPSSVPTWAVNEQFTGEDILATVERPDLISQYEQANDPSSPPVGASNGFVLSGSKTTTGKPILEGDPHLPFAGADQWYEAQLSFPGHSVEGATWRGLPFIAIGTNGNVTWTFTANQTTANEQDLYQETLNPANQDQYLYNGSYQNMTVDHMLISVQTAPGVIKQVPVTFRYTLHGPVTSDPRATVNGGQPPPGTTNAMSTAASQYEQIGLATEFFGIDGAHSIADLQQAMAMDQLSSRNALAADASDNIYFVAASRSGILNEGVNPKAPYLDGTNPNDTWQGILPFADLPQAENPTSGYYENANNAPQYTAPGQINQAGIPFYLRGGGNGARSERQTSILGGASNLSLPDVESIGLDTYLQFAPSLKALLDQAAALPSSDPAVKAAAALFDAWNDEASADSTAFPLFATWVRGLNPQALGFDPVNDPPPPSTVFTAAQMSEASRAMLVAYNGMMAKYGTISVPYGTLHTFTWGSFTSPLGGASPDVPTLFMAGCPQSHYAKSPVAYFPCPVSQGTSYLINVDLGSSDMAVMRPAPDTDDTSSPFYTEDAQQYAANAYRQFPTTRSAVDAEKTSVEVLMVPTAPTAPVMTKPASDRGSGVTH